MSVLVDSSIWIEYFRGKNDTEVLDRLIDEGLVVINDLILAELIPFLKLKKQGKLISLLHLIRKAPVNIDWEHIINMQVKCLQKGINKLGIPDLIIAQNAIHNSLSIYSRDKHFRLMSRFTPLTVY